MDDFVDYDVLLKDISDDANVFKLEDGIPFVLGRNREIRIKDTRCSRTQLLITPNVKDKSVLVEQIGSNPSALRGVPLRRGEKRRAGHDDIIEVLDSCYFFKIEFIPRQKTRRVEQPATTNGSSLSHFLKDSALKSKGSWNCVSGNSLLVFTSDGIKSRTKIAAFDLDGTIITTISGHVYPKDHNDWKMCFPQVTSKLKELHEQEYKIVLFTNQGGIGRGKTRVSDFKKKIESVARKLQVPIQVFISGMDDIYRKPRIGMWQHLLEHANENIDMDVSVSFYCGDAAGRPANCEPNKKKKDFSCSDRLLALNLNLKFYTPEEYFLGWKTAPFDLPEFSPTSLDVDGPLLDPSTARLVSEFQEIVIMIGCPGSGKSFFSKKYLESAGYVYVNRDTLKTWQKCVALAEKSVKDGLSVVIDNTNPDKQSRARYTSIAEKYNIPTRAFWMATSLEHAKHNNTFRQILACDSHDLIPNHSLNGFLYVITMAILKSLLQDDYVLWNIFFYILHRVPKKLKLLLRMFGDYFFSNILELPTLDEGFQEIVRINLVPRFEDDNKKKLYYMYLLER